VVSYFPRHKYRSLLFQLSGFVLITTVLVLALFAGYRYQQQSKQLDAELMSLLEANTGFLATSLQVPIYNYDLHAAEAICEAVIQAKEVVSVSIENVTNVNLAFVKNDQGEVQRTKSPLIASEILWRSENITHKGKNIGVVRVGVTKKYRNESISSTLKLIVIQIIVLAFLLAVPLILLLRYRFVIPIQQLTSVSSSIASGDLEQAVISYRNDELGELAKTFSIMQESIKEKIKDLNNEVAERKQAEYTLRSLRNYLSNIIDSMPSILIGVESDGNVTQWNAEAVRVTGVSEKEALGKSLDQSFPRLSKEMDIVRVAIKLGQKQTVRERQYRQDGRARYEDMIIYPLMANGVEGAVIRLDDITEKIANEIALRRAQKMEAVGHLTGGIAHDFNNILGVVMGNLQLLKRSVVDAAALERIESALKGTLRGAEITRKLLRFSRLEPQEAKLTLIHKVVETVRELLAKSLTVSIEVQTHFPENLWPVMVDPGDLGDAILNLSLNAKDAMPNGGNLVIEAANKVLDEIYVSHNPGSTPGEFVMLSVSDNGTGMTEEVKEKVLEPFFTTKGPGKGTGLGLSMVYGFIRRSGGHLKIYSELGQGTTFQLFFPRAEDDTETEAGDDHPDSTLPTGSETILVVDDEDSLLGIASDYLSQLGYQVFCARDAEQALNVLNDHKEIDLVFSDVIMPGELDGYQLAEQIQHDYPTLKILMTSGFTKRQETDDNHRNAYLLKLAERRLYKPYSLSELAITLRRTLDGQ